MAYRHKRFIYEVHSKKFWDVEHDVELGQKWDYTYVPSKVTLVTAQNVIIPYHLLFDQTALEMFDRMVFVLAAMMLPQCDYRVMIYNDFMKGLTQDKS